MHGRFEQRLTRLCPREDKAGAIRLVKERIAFIVAFPGIGADQISQAASAVRTDLAAKLDMAREDPAPAVMIAHAALSAVFESCYRLSRPAITAIAEG